MALGRRWFIVAPITCLLHLTPPSFIQAFISLQKGKRKRNKKTLDEMIEAIHKKNTKTNEFSSKQSNRIGIGLRSIKSCTLRWVLP
jgi:hypothetical protein